MKSLVSLPFVISTNPTQSSSSMANWLLSIFFLYHFAQLLESYPSPSYNSLADTACLPLFSFIYFTPAQSWARVLPSSKPRNPDINQFSVNACHLYKIELKPIRAKISRFKEQQANGGKMFRKKNRIAPGALNKARECNRTSAPQRAWDYHISIFTGVAKNIMCKSILIKFIHFLY